MKRVFSSSAIIIIISSWSQNGALVAPIPFRIIKHQPRNININPDDHERMMAVDRAFKSCAHQKYVFLAHKGGCARGTFHLTAV